MKVHLLMLTAVLLIAPAPLLAADGVGKKSD